MSSGVPAPTLASLRREIDGIDDALHDLLMRRASVVERVAGLARVGKVPFRPGREADVINRLLARHAGPLARRAIVRWWREIYAAHIGIETPFTIAVAGDAYAAVAREHFGALTPLRVQATAAEVIADVTGGTATAGVLPMPDDADWWPSLLAGDDRVHVVARLPFWTPRPEGAPTSPALVVAAAAADLSGDDRSLIEVGTDAGFEAADVLARGHGAILLDVAGRVAEDDSRLTALPASLIGYYAVPVTQ